MKISIHKIKQVVLRLNWMKVLGWFLQFICIVGQEYPTMEGIWQYNFYKKQMRVILSIGHPFSCPLPSRDRERNSVAGPFLRNPDWTSLYPGSIFPYHTRVPLPIFFQSPPLYPSVFIYRIPLMRMSWWKGYSPGWWVPLCYIPDHMGLATHS